MGWLERMDTHNQAVLERQNSQAKGPPRPPPVWVRAMGAASDLFKLVVLVVGVVVLVGAAVRHDLASLVLAGVTVLIVGPLLAVRVMSRKARRDHRRAGAR